MSERMRRSWPWRRDPEEVGDGEMVPANQAVDRPAILRDESSLRERYRSPATPSFMFISLFGMTDEAIVERAALVDEELAQQGLIPIYLVDEPEFSPMRAEQRLFEYLPSHWRGVRHAPDLDWPFYLRRRYLLLQAKWQPIGRIDFGDIPDWLPDHQDVLPPDQRETPRS